MRGEVGFNQFWSWLHPAALPYMPGPWPTLIPTPPPTHFTPPLQPSWLVQSGTPLARLSAPLAQPPPTYRRDVDRVLAWHDVAYGRHEWALPPVLRPHPDVRERAAVFAAALLEGQVLPAMAGGCGDDTCE